MFLSINDEKKARLNIQISNAYISDRPTKVEHCEYVSDAYYEIIKAEQEGLITICRTESTQKILLLNCDL